MTYRSWVMLLMFLISWWFFIKLQESTFSDFMCILCVVVNDRIGKSSLLECFVCCSSSELWLLRFLKLLPKGSVIIYPFHANFLFAILTYQFIVEPLRKQNQPRISWLENNLRFLWSLSVLCDWQRGGKVLNCVIKGSYWLQGKLLFARAAVSVCRYVCAYTSLLLTAWRSHHMWLKVLL
jgi:hypothetical protein